LNATPFDSTAQGYDLEFTETEVGKLQRAVTYRFLNDLINVAQPRTVLELNCGTGQDALWLAQQGLNVTATDLSAEMVKATIAKTQGQNVTVLQTGIQGIGQALHDQQFDLIWSNFGGLNCLSAPEIEKLAKDLQNLLKPDGYFVAVVMGKFCLWETLYFLAKFKFGQAFRRMKRGPIKAQLAQGVFQDTYYYSVGEFERLMGAEFIPTRRLAVGAYLPPSYLDPFFKRRPKLLARMARWENRAYSKKFPAQYSDHFLVAFQRK
jgi:SAM-dependent methyltransferase